MAEPYRKGEYVRYACNGVCLVDDIRLDVPAGKGTPKEFYILKPVSNPASTIFVPTGSPALVEKMARLPNREELDQLILSVKDHPLPWIEDRKARLASFQTIVKACDLRELICLVVCISRRKRSLLATGKKLGASDETLLQRAEGLIANQVSFVLQVEDSQVGTYIREKLTSWRARHRITGPGLLLRPGPVILSLGVITSSNRTPARHTRPGRAGGGPR